MGLVWIKALTLKTGFANVLATSTRCSSGWLRALDPTPMVTHHMPLDEAPEAYAAYDRREALKIVLTP